MYSLYLVSYILITQYLQTNSHIRALVIRSSKLRLHNVSKTVNNQSTADLIFSKFIRQTEETLSINNNDENNNTLNSVNLNSFINELQSSVTYN